MGKRKLTPEEQRAYRELARAARKVRHAEERAKKQLARKRAKEADHE